MRLRCSPAGHLVGVFADPGHVEHDVPPRPPAGGLRANDRGVARQTRFLVRADAVVDVLADVASRRLGIFAARRRPGPCELLLAARRRRPRPRRAGRPARRAPRPSTPAAPSSARRRTAGRSGASTPRPGRAPRPPRLHGGAQRGVADEQHRVLDRLARIAARLGGHAEDDVRAAGRLKHQVPGQARARPAGRRREGGSARTARGLRRNSKTLVTAPATHDAVRPEESVSDALEGLVDRQERRVDLARVEQRAESATAPPRRDAPRIEPFDERHGVQVGNDTEREHGMRNLSRPPRAGPPSARLRGRSPPRQSKRPRPR